MASIVAAIISALATLAASLIASRRRDPVAAASPVPAGAPRSRSVWVGAAGMILWIIPLLAFIELPFGFYAAFSDRGQKRGTTTGLILCSIALALAIINAAAGAYQGGHCQLFFQHQTAAGCVQ